MSSLTSGENSNVGVITIVCGWTFTFLALLSLISLFLARRSAKFAPELDDFLLMAAFIFTLLLVSQTTWAVIDEGQGSHIADLSRSQFSLVAKSLLSNETLWGLVNTLVRISVIMFMKRVFLGLGLSPRALIAHILLTLSVLYGAVFILQVLLICRPIAASWDHNIGGSCGNEVTAYIVLEILGLIIDLAIAIFPIPLILQIKMTLRQRFSIIAIFSGGTLVIIITGLRIKALHIVNSADFTYSQGYISLLSILGALLSIILCCAPALPLLIRGTIKAQRRESRRGKTPNTHPSVEIII